MIQDALEAEANAIRNIPATNPFVEWVALFLEAKRNGGKLIISGVGKAGEVGKKIAVTFCCIALPSVVLHPLEAQHGDLGLLICNDVLSLISNSGKTREMNFATLSNIEWSTQLLSTWCNNTLTRLWFLLKNRSKFKNYSSDWIWLS